MNYQNNGGKNLLKSMATVSGGAIAGQLFILAITPILTRIYDVEIFGYYVIISSLSTMIMAISSGKYEILISIIDESDVHHVIRLCLFLPLVISTALYAVIELGGENVTQFFGLDRDRAIPLYAASLLFFSSIPICVDFQNLRDGKVVLSGVGRLVQYATQGTAQIAGGLLGLGIKGLVGGVVLGSIIRMTIFTLSLNGDLRRQIFLDRWPRTWILAVRNWRYPTLTGTSSLIFNASQSAIPMICGSIGGPQAAGIYGAAQRIVYSPVRFLANSVTRVFMTELRKDKDSIFTFLIVSIILLIIGFIIYIPIFIFGPNIFGFALGKEWSESGKLARALCPALLVRLIMTPIVNVLNRYNLQHINLIFSVLSTISSVGLFWNFYSSGFSLVFSIWVFSISYSAIGAIHYSYMLLILIRRKHEQ